MSSAEATTIATAFVATRDMHGFTTTCIEARKREQWPNEWSVIFDLFDSKGRRMDGPMIVIVDEATSQARLFESP